MRRVSVRKMPKTVEVAATGVVEEGLDATGDAAQALERLGFAAKASEVAVIADDDVLRAYVGLGKADELDSAVVREAAAALLRRVADNKTVGLDLGAAADHGLDVAELAKAVGEAIPLSLYAFDDYKSDANGSKVQRVSVVLPGRAAVTEAFEAGLAIGDAVCFARDLVNEPGGSLTPVQFARKSAAMARKTGLRAKVWDLAAIRKGKLGGVLGVNRGSDNDPRLVELTYDPGTKNPKTLALVGKGITFDAGGLSIKTAQGMSTMKCDMGGAAAVIGAISALPAVAPRCRVKAWVPMTDNMLGGDATRPGDVLTIRNGKTIEVLNTDAEGRLILADGLSLASEAEPDAIVDLATLTGACMVALGRGFAGVMGNDDDLRAKVEAAADTTGEKVWPLPLPSEYRPMIDSTVADMKNTGGSYGGAITAGLLLQEFVGDGIPWAHIDVAGPAWTDEEDSLTRRGGTGYGVRLLVELATNFA